ncbi:MAG: ankyrin repeat domain-containing protein [Candidatus Eremiobacteraeota bacterium]|nr:ankyrin repeat domain-containing protein [Candidatus Eremiobacteraeota bacterium]
MPEFCLVCGQENDDASRFCAGCGESFIEGGIKKGTVFHDKYEIQQILEFDSGQTSALANDTHLVEPVIIKEIRISFQNPGDRASLIRKFTNKAGDLSRLFNKGLPRMSDCFITENADENEAAFYIIRKFIKGKSLEKLMEDWQGKPFPVEAATDYFLQMIDTLDYLHSENPSVLCGNLKPANVFIQDPSASVLSSGNSEYGNTFILSFGFADVFKSDQYNVFKNTRGFAAPEQSGKGISKSTDLYSLGAIMYYLFTGVNPAEVSGDGRPLREIVEINPEVPGEINSLIMSMLNVSPGDRPDSARSIKKRLRIVTGRTRGKSSLKLKKSLEINTEKKNDSPIKRTSFMSAPLNVKSAPQKVKPPEIKLPPTRTFERVPTLGDFRRPRGRIISQKTVEEPIRNIRTGAALHEQSMLERNKKTHHVSFAVLFVILALVFVVLVFFFPRTLDNILKKVKPETDGKTIKKVIPLHEAAFKGNGSLVESLINEGEKVNEVDSLGSTALHKAAQKGRLDVVKILLENNAFVDSKNNFSMTPLHFAAREGHRLVVICLIQHGADVHAVNLAQQTPLALAKKYEHHDIVEVLENYNKYIKLDSSDR